MCINVLFCKSKFVFWIVLFRVSPKSTLLLHRGLCKNSDLAPGVSQIWRVCRPAALQHIQNCLISGLRREVDESCALPGYYTASTDNSRPSTREVYPEGCRHRRGITTTRCIITQNSAVLIFMPIFRVHVWNLKIITELVYVMFIKPFLICI